MYYLGARLVRAVGTEAILEERDWVQVEGYPESNLVEVDMVEPEVGQLFPVGNLMEMEVYHIY